MEHGDWDAPAAALPDPLPPLPARLQRIADLTGPTREDLGDWARPAELPEVQALAADGWVAPGDNPYLLVLVAAWPVEHRCWVPDRLPRFSWSRRGDDTWWEPWHDEDHTSVDKHLRSLTDEAGLPPAPRGRIWLVRSPWPSVGVETLLRLVAKRTYELQPPERCEDVVPRLAALRELLSWSEEQLWRWWDDDVARAWRAVGRTGNDVDPLLLHGLSPTDVAAADLDEDRLLAWADLLDECGPDLVDLVTRWRAVLGDDPPPRLPDSEPEQAAAWLAAGFALQESDCGLTLTDALAWTASGVPLPEAVALRRADPLLTIEEALAFDVPDRLRWVEDGFDADDARAWHAVGVYPGEARVWRSQGLTPADAAHAQQLLPPGTEVGWFGFGDGGRASRRYGVTDPPGTRGSTARGDG